MDCWHLNRFSPDLSVIHDNKKDGSHVITRYYQSMSLSHYHQNMSGQARIQLTLVGGVGEYCGQPFSEENFP